ncbi:glucose-6-phosphate dehydrogenase [Microbacterium sp.]|uniref:glucose-6-phosphate dehydrogenase n=1 Tax=Microbacterium sp. TaxID=51671 RepID=UPI003A86611F
MRITRSSDWRDALTFDVPLRAAEVAPGDPAKCAGCPGDADALDRSALWAVKHRHPTNPAGFVRFYCAAHTPKLAGAASGASRAPGAARRTAARSQPAPERERLPRRTPRADVVRAMCPNCFVEVSATGECGMCGERVG